MAISLQQLQEMVRQIRLHLPPGWQVDRSDPLLDDRVVLLRKKPEGYGIRFSMSGKSILMRPYKRYQDEAGEFHNINYLEGIEGERIQERWKTPAKVSALNRLLERYLPKWDEAVRWTKIELEQQREVERVSKCLAALIETPFQYEKGRDHEMRKYRCWGNPDLTVNLKADVKGTIIRENDQFGSVRVSIRLSSIEPEQALFILKYLKPHDYQKVSFEEWCREVDISINFRRKLISFRDWLRAEDEGKILKLPYSNFDWDYRSHYEQHYSCEEAAVQLNCHLWESGWQPDGKASPEPASPKSVKGEAASESANETADKATSEEAIAPGVEQLDGSEGLIDQELAAPDQPVEQVRVKIAIPHSELSDSQLIERIRVETGDVQLGWSRFIGYRNLNPGMDMSKFIQLWESNPHANPHLMIQEMKFTATHIQKETGLRVQISEPDERGVRQILFEDGAKGSLPSPQYVPNIMDGYTPLSSSPDPSEAVEIGQ